MLTGRLCSEYRDENPNSPTYNQTKWICVTDTNTCASTDPNWVLTNQMCELDGNGNPTGNRIDTYTDENPKSPTYMTDQQQIVADLTTCPLVDATPDWQIFNSICETIIYMPGNVEGFSGNYIVWSEDMNQYSPTYGDTQQTITYDPVNCPPEDTTADWVDISVFCITENQGGTMVNTGEAKVTQEDRNVYSPTYGSIQEITRTDLTNCPVIDSYTVNFITNNSLIDSSLTGGGTYNSGSSCTLTCPLTWTDGTNNYTFGWMQNNMGTTVSTNNIYTFTVNSNITITAYYS